MQKEKRREGEEGDRVRDLERNSRDLIVRWRGLSAKRRKEGRVAARRQGVGKEKSQGETLGFGG